MSIQELVFDALRQANLRGPATVTALAEVTTLSHRQVRAAIRRLRERYDIKDEAGGLRLAHSKPNSVRDVKPRWYGPREEIPTLSTGSRQKPAWAVAAE